MSSAGRRGDRARSETTHDGSLDHAVRLGCRPRNTITGRVVSLRVAVLGDSIMWGQGLRPEEQFARLAAQELAGDDEVEVLPGSDPEPRRGLPRSGAKISARVRDGTDQKILLPTGGLGSAPPGDRADFAGTFRSLFADDARMRAFLAGPAGDAPAAALFGENPATFPTVTGQLAMAGGPHPGIDYVIVNGGANDVDFETVLDPEGPALTAINNVVDQVYGTALATLLTDVRRRFPNAVVLVTGYFSALSEVSDRGALKELFEYLSGRPQLLLAYNNLVQAIPGVGDLLEFVGLSQDVPALVRLAIRRSMATAAYAHYRTRATIAGLPPSVRLPGLIYVHPAFRAQHALFAGQSLLHSGYRQPGEGGLVVADGMLERRLQRIPRVRLLDDYHDLARRVSRLQVDRARETDDDGGGGIGLDLPTQENKLRSALTVLREANPDLPGPLLLFLRATDLTDERLARLKDLLFAEIGRIETATIASFIHPNPDGARRYAERIVRVHRRHRAFSLRRGLVRMAPTEGAVSMRRAFERRAGELPRRLTTLAAVTPVESIAIRLTGLVIVPGLFSQATRLTDVRFGPELQTRMAVRLGVGADETTAFTAAFDPSREVDLTEITGIVIAEPPSFDEIELHLNGLRYRTWARADGTNVAGILQFQL